jgi:hypothetical protein
MNPVIAAGLLLGVLCGVWMFVMGFTGWYRDPSLVNLFFLVIPIEIGVIVWALRKTVRQGRTYGGQVLAGTAIAVIGGLIIIGFSLVFTTVAFPNYFTEIQAVQRETLAAQGKSESEIAAAINAGAAMQTPIMNALAGFMGTVITGVLTSLSAAWFIRARPASATTSRV